MYDDDEAIHADQFIFTEGRTAYPSLRYSDHSHRNMIIKEALEATENHANFLKGVKFKYAHGSGLHIDFSSIHKNPFASHVVAIVELALVAGLQTIFDRSDRSMCQGT
jgi:hypothetical protein